jgi:hypothetical protein
MPQLPNPSEPGQPGIRGRESEPAAGAEVDHTQPDADRARADGRPQGRQPQHPGQPARWQGSVGERDEGSSPR